MTAEEPQDGGATSALFTTVYAELKRLAHGQLRAVDAHATLSTTELVHEAYVKIARGNAHDWEGRGHLLGVASRAMRQVLVDFARRRRAAKRGGGVPLVTIGDSQAQLHLELDRVLELDRALDRLDAVNERLRRVVELRFFGGVPEQDVARVLGVSARTVERDWLKARLFLLEALEPKDGGAGPAHPISA